MAIELTVVSVLLKRCVTENGAAVVPGDTVVQLYIVVLLGTLWFHFCVACGTVFIAAQWCRLLHCEM